MEWPGLWISRKQSKYVKNSHWRKTHRKKKILAYPVHCSRMYFTPNGISWIMFVISIVKQKKYVNIFNREKFSEDDCWSSHKESNFVNDKFECHTCKEVFNTKNIMMKHRKPSHRTKQCNEFIKRACQKSDEHCWYMHTNQDFRQPLFNPPPP